MRTLALGLIALFAPQTASADEIIHLIDKTRIVGNVVHYFDGLLTVKLPSGANMKLPREKVSRIQFKLPKPRTALSSAKKTFDRLRKAALKGDLDTYLDAHSTYYQMFLNHQVAQAGPRKFRKQLKKEWGSVQLKVVSSKKKGDMAVLKVQRKHGSNSEEGEFRFVKENGEWKMILPL